jgi:FkbM family methyltransferase
MQLKSRLKQLVKRGLDRPGGRQALHWFFHTRSDLEQIFVSARIWLRCGVWPPLRRHRLMQDPVGEGALGRDLLFQEYTPRPGDTVIDVGAGAGGYVNDLSRCVGSTGRVYSIEAHPVTFESLSRLCKEQVLTNVTPVNVAVSDAEGIVRMSDEDHHILNSMTTNDEGLQVQAVTLDQFISERGINRVDFLMMNIEGAEVRALRGMRHSAPRVANLMVSCHDFLAPRQGVSFRTKDDVRGLLLEYGFSVTRRWRGDLRPYARDYVYARRQVSATYGRL